MNGSQTAHRNRPRLALPSLATNAAGVQLHPRLAEIAAYLTFCVVVVIDALTPPSLAIEIAYEVAVVFASLTGKRPLVLRFVALGFVGNLFGLLSDAAQTNPPWEAIALENRLLSLVSIIIVATLTLVVRGDAERTAARRAGDRAQALAAAADRILAALDEGALTQTIAREASHALGAAEALWLPADPTWTAWRSRAGFEPTPERQPPVLERGAHDRARVLTAEESALAFGAAGSDALLVPVSHRGDDYGAIVVAWDRDDVAREGAAAQYARFCASAIRQAILLGRLDRNERSLLERHAVIDGLVEAISHDVRTPLAALSMTLAQAARGAYGPLDPAYVSVIRESRISIDDIARLAETLLLVARFESDRPVASEPVDLRRIADDLVGEFGDLAAARQLSIHANVPADCVVRASRPDVRRALTNLIANALAHTPPGGKVEIGCTRTGNEIDLAVSDDGYGVAAPARDALFRRHGHVPTGAGHGLGLYIVRRVAENAGGRVRYEPGVPTGSRFVLTLPQAKPLAV